MLLLPCHLYWFLGIALFFNGAHLLIYFLVRLVYNPLYIPSTHFTYHVFIALVSLFVLNTIVVSIHLRDEYSLV